MLPVAPSLTLLTTVYRLHAAWFGYSGGLDSYQKGVYIFVFYTNSFQLLGNKLAHLLINTAINEFFSFTSYFFQSFV